MTADPFRETVGLLIKYDYTYTELARACGGARSSSWLNNVVNYGSRCVNPPPPEILHKFAQGFGASTEHVAEMVCRSWYGMSFEDDVSDRVRRLAPEIDDLDEGDYALLKQLIGRLSKTTSETSRQQVDDQVA